MAKFYKELSTCKRCKKRYTVDKGSELYDKSYMAKRYCKKCYQKIFE